MSKLHVNEINAKDSDLTIKTSNVTAMTIDSNGYVTTPNRPAFYVHTPGGSAGGGGDGTANGYLAFSVTKHNVGNHFDGTNFTCPVAGLYSFTWHILSTGVNPPNWHYGFISHAPSGGSSSAYAYSQVYLYNETNVQTGTHHGATVTILCGAGDITALYHYGNYCDAHQSNYSWFSGHLIG